MSQQQLLQGVKTPNIYRFENFYPVGNEEAIQCLKKGLSAQPRGDWFYYLWGSQGCGRSHLLQAACDFADSLSLTSSYLPLKELKQHDPDVLNNLEQFDLICIDDVDEIVESEAWQEALFHLYNRVQAANSLLCVSATCAPRLLTLTLADLQSRLSAGICFQMPTPDDEKRINVLQCHAQYRDMIISDSVLQYLLHHCTRDLATLCGLLVNLDEQSLQLGRAITIPFVRVYLQSIA